MEVKTGETRGIVKPPSVVAVNVAWTSVRRGLTSPAFGRLELPGTEKEDDKILDSFERELDKLAMEWYVSAPSGSSSSGSSCVRNPTDRTSCLTTYENPLSHPPPQPNQPGDEIYVLASNSIWESKTYYFVQEDKTSSSQSQKEFRRDWVQAVSDLGARWGAGVQSLGVKRAAKGEDWLVSPRLSKNSSTTTTTTTTTSTTSSRPLPNNFPTFSPAAIPLPIIFLYFLLMAYIMFCLSNAHQAHSRFGLAFTGIIELGCSTVMSFSVMILFGWGGERWNQVAEMDALNGRGVAGVPWYLLPFVVVIVGAENMSAVVSHDKEIYPSPQSYKLGPWSRPSLTRYPSTDRSGIFHPSHILRSRSAWRSARKSRQIPFRDICAGHHRSHPHPIDGLPSTRQRSLHIRLRPDLCRLVDVAYLLFDSLVN